MIVFLAIVSVVLLALIVYFAVSRKSSRLLRLSAIIALGLICVSLVISGILLLEGATQAEIDVPLPVLSDTEGEVKRSGNITDILFIGILVLVLGLIILKALRDQKKEPPVQKNAEKPAFINSGSLDDFEIKTKNNITDDDESFDIEIE